ncbi:hypothetical protein RUND412_001802 [Rhizina undulata]
MQKAKNSASPSLDPRLTRIRNNQRRSRARRKEYLEGLEERWKKCQEMGVQANVDLQKAARKVIEENRLLRSILRESGMPDDLVDSRLKELNTQAIAAAAQDAAPPEVSSPSMPCIAGPSSSAASCCARRVEIMPMQNNECCPPTTGLEACLLDSSLSEAASGLLSAAQLDEIFSAPPESFLENYNPSSSASSTVGAPSTVSASSTVGPDGSDLGFGLSSLDMQRLADMEIDPMFLHDFSTTTSPLPEPSPGLGPLESQPEALATLSPAPPSLSSMSSICPPFNPHVPSNLPPHPNARNISKSNSTPCTMAYQLLNSINAMRRNEKDMLDIVLELWNGFSLVDGSEEGCRVDNEVLFRVVGGLAEQKNESSGSNTPSSGDLRPLIRLNPTFHFRGLPENLAPNYCFLRGTSGHQRFVVRLTWHANFGHIFAALWAKWYNLLATLSTEP